MERWTVHFTGRVQGVGFRYSTVRIARELAVTGFVQNLSDGRVRLVAEGAADELERFEADVFRAMADHIVEAKRDRTAASGEFDEFGIRH